MDLVHQNTTGILFKLAIAILTVTDRKNKLKGPPPKKKILQDIPKAERSPANISDMSGA